MEWNGFCDKLRVSILSINGYITEANTCQFFETPRFGCTCGLAMTSCYANSGKGMHVALLLPSNSCVYLLVASFFLEMFFFFKFMD